MAALPKIVIIGRPNVGKSSLFNRLIGQRKAIVHGVAGTTRDLVSEKLFFDNKAIELFDTAGYLKEKEELSEKALQKVREAIDFADELVFVVDGNVAPTNIDIVLADIVRKSGKSVALVINKADNPKIAKQAEEYKRFGFKTMFFVSAIHNIGMSDLILSLKKKAVKTAKKEEAEKVRVAIIGRPNVGKSSLLNAMVGKERSIVSNIPGTTRDVVTDEIVADGFVMTVADTAGARKPGKIGKAYKKGEPVEKFSFLRTEREMENSDIVLVVIDSDDKIAAQDLHIAGKAKEMGKGIVLVINKWDLVKETQQDKFLARLRHHFNFMMWVPAIFVSAKSGRNIDQIMDLVKTVSENQRRQVNTSKLNRILEDFSLGNTPKGLGTYRPKLFFIAQTDTVPPTFTITAKHHNFVHFSWRRAFENELRRNFDFTGTPISVVFKAKQ
jgi:GTP-binding protein